MNWRFWKQRSIEIIRRDRVQLTLTEWQADSKLVLLAQRELARPEIQIMLDVVRNVHLRHQVYSVDCNPNVRVVAQAQAEGYTMALANLEALGKFKALAPDAEPTFEPEEISR